MSRMKKKHKILSLFIVLLLIMGASGFYLNQQLKPMSKESDIVLFTVNADDNLTTITKALEAEDIIKSADIAKFYGRFIAKPQFIAGNFQLDRSKSVGEIFTDLQNQDNIVKNDVTITLIPGSWAKDMAKTLSSKLLVSEDELLTLWSDETFIKEMISEYEFLTDDILNQNLRVYLEGYLAPNTYNFYVDATAQDVTRVLLNQTNKIFNEHRADFLASKYSIHEIFTLASITQYESGDFEHDQIIAGIWYNRLDLNMKLQSSVTVCYSLYEYTNWQECETNINIDSPFNTYLYSGIPIGPILNPGEGSIIATLKPKATDYLYFIADVYGDNTIYYAKTFEEHNANVNKYLRP